MLHDLYVNVSPHRLFDSVLMCRSTMYGRSQPSKSITNGAKNKWKN
jgi:hypothetical protein